MIEPLSPTGTLKSMRYAFAYGADAVYMGAAALQPASAQQRIQSDRKPGCGDRRRAGRRSCQPEISATAC